MAEHTRTLGFWTAFAIGLGTMIAAGIFSLSGTAVALIGSSAVIAFVIAALVAGITAAAYSEFASIYSENGGGYLFTSRTFEGRELLTYGVGMSLFLGYTGTTAFYLATMDEWVFEFILPEGLHWLPPGTPGVATAVLLGTLNARGTEESGTFQLLVTGAKVAVLLAFIGGAFAYRGPATAAGNFAEQFVVAPVEILSVAALAFITFFGFSAIAASAGEIIEPRRTVPRAIAASILTVTVLYAFVIVAMTNSTVPPEVIARQGETAMGAVAAGFLGPIGQSLIVAGAIFSMVSASNASVLAASGIGSLMGRQGHAPRPFSRIHPQFATPFWSVTAATATIVVLIVGFVTLFGHEGALAPVHLGASLSFAGVALPSELALGLTALTGFATLNLLLPLAVVNVALVYHRRSFPDIERGFRVPGVPLVPALGVVANVALIYNLPVAGVVSGLVLVGAFVAAYLVWGGNEPVEDIVQRVVEPGGAAPNAAAAEAANETASSDRFRVLVPIARPDRAPNYVRLAASFARARSDDPVVQVLNVTAVPDQTPFEVVSDTARKRAERIESVLDDVNVGVEYTVEGHTSKDVGFDIVQTARDDGADLVMMGYPEEHYTVAEEVEYGAPCDVLFVGGVRPDDLDTITLGAGGGPHHEGAVSMARALGEQGADVHVVSVSPADGGGTPETVEETLDLLAPVEASVVETSAGTVAEALVSAAAERGGVLLVGASRTRRLRRWVFGSTPDRVVERASEAGVPVVVYASESDIRGSVEDYLFPAYRHLRRLFSRERPSRSRYATE